MRRRTFRKYKRYKLITYKSYYIIDSEKGYFFIYDKYKNLIFQWEYANIENKEETISLIKLAIDTYEKERGEKCYV